MVIINAYVEKIAFVVFSATLQFLDTNASTKFNFRDIKEEG